MKKILAEVDRRSLFRYLGNAALYYPFMRTLFETEAFGANVAKRAVFYYFPSGIVQENFHPKETGTKFELPLSTAPLNSVKDDIIILKGVNYKTGHSHNEGSRYSLTAAPSGASLDIYLGEKFKADVKIPVLRLGVNSQLRGGYDSNVSFTAGGAPSTIEDNPQKAFDSVFGGSAFRLADTSVDSSKSLLDFCLDDIKSLQMRLGTIEKQKLDSHLDALRELERRAKVPDKSEGQSSGGSTACTKKVNFNGLTIPDNVNGNPADFPFYQSANFNNVFGIMNDIAVQALACGQTNIVLLQAMHSIDDVFLMDFPGGPGITSAQHAASHHDFNPEKMLTFSKIQVYFMQQYAQLLGKMKAVAEGDKSLLYNSVTLAFSELGNPGSHEMDNVGLVMGGQAGGKIKSGQCLDATGKDHSNVLVSVIQAMGLPDNTYGNGGSGPIPGILV